MPFDVTPTGAITSLSPASGPVGGGTFISFVGSDLGRGVDYRCRFRLAANGSSAAPDEVVVEATLLDASTQAIVCYSPSHPGPAGPRQLAVATNGQQYVSPLSFQAFLPPAIALTTPTTGPVRGGTVVLVAGGDLSGGSDYRCRFGGTTVSASRGAASTINCTSPLAASGELPLRVSLNGQQFSPSSVYAYYGGLSLRSNAISPTTGPNIGETAVTVSTGSTLALAGGSEYSCSFGAAGVVPAIYSSGNSTATCLSPHTLVRPGRQPFLISLNGQQFEESTATFGFLGRPSIGAPAPLSGPRGGGTLVEFGGDDLAGGSHYLCRIDDAVVSATLFSYDAVRCVTPPSERLCDGFGRCRRRTGNASCEVSLNGQQYTERVGFGYHQTPRISASSPACGPTSGDTLVSVHGAGFANGTDYICAFDKTRVPAQFYIDPAGGESLHCFLPPGQADSGTMQLAVTLNGQQYAMQLLNFHVYHAVPIGLEPPLGPVAGGTRIEIAVANVSADCDVRAAFDGASQLSLLRTPKPPDDRTAQVLATVPGGLHGPNTTLRISLNGQQYSGKLAFSLLPGPRVDALSPISGPVHGGTAVHVLGTHFRNTSQLRCRLGRRLVVPTFLASSLLECVVPPSVWGAATDALPTLVFTPTETAAVDTECYTDVAAASYAGHVNATRQGHGCQRWSVQAPHAHRVTVRTHLGNGLGDHNFCRNPNGVQASAWCFTTSAETRWALCNLPPPRATCRPRMLVGGSAVISDGTLQLTPTNGVFGYATVPVSLMLPASIVGTPLGALHLAFDILVLSDPRGKSPYADRHQSGLSVHYGPAPGANAIGVHCFVPPYDADTLNPDSSSIACDDALQTGLTVQLIAHEGVGRSHGPHMRVLVNGVIMHATRPSQGVEQLNSFVPMEVRLAHSFLSVSYGDSLLVDGLHLVGLGEPRADWAMSIAASSRGGARSIDNLRVLGPHSDRLAEVGVAVTLNLQDYTAGLPYLYTPVLVPHSVSPASGPLTGGTELLVQGTGIAAGPDPRCRIGGIDVAAVASHGSMMCTTPGNLSGIPAGVPLRLSLNGQDLSLSALLFATFAPPRLSRLSLGIGPARGGTLLTVHGANLDTRDSARCRFGGVGRTVLATLARADGAGVLACTAPSQSPTIVALEVSLNAQDYTSDDLPYEYTAPPAVATLSPSSGPAVGGVAVLLEGVGLIKNTADFACRFGHARVPATVVGLAGGAARCFAPCGAAAGAQSILAVDFSAGTVLRGGAEPAFETAYELRGGATVLRDGALSLTELEYHVSGTAVFGIPALRSAPASSFRASFDAYMGEGTGGEGLSFCYGAPPPRAPVTAAGTASGLCVRFRTRDFSGLPRQTIEVAYDGAVLESTESMPPESLRVGAWVAVEIEHGAGGLRIVFNGRIFFNGVHITAYEPKLSWRFVLGAGTSAWRDAHRVDSLRLNVGALVGVVAVGVELTTNGQQFSSSAAAFSYYPPPVVSYLSPAAGPAAGGTLLTLSGSGFFISTSQRELIRCRFLSGDNVLVVAASLAYAQRGIGLLGGALLCRSPARPLPAAETVSFTINAQDYTSSVSFASYAPPALESLSPTAGPTRGGTRVVLRGPNVGGGDSRTRRCVFGALGLTPARSLGPATALCTSPPRRTGHEGPVEVTLALNLQDLSSPINFTYYAPSRIGVLSPTTGPSEGGTVVRVGGDFSSRGSEYACAFARDESRIPASVASQAALLCRVTPLLPGTYAVAVTLNGADFTDAGLTTFSTYEPPLLLGISPSSGPLRGGTRLAVSGGGLFGGSHSLCAFSGAKVAAASASSDAALVCISPAARRGGSAQRVGLSLNGQQLLHSAAAFAYFDEPTVTGLSPATGPLSGGTRVVLSGSALSGGSHSFCRFGSAPPVPLVPLLGSGNATCLAPPVEGIVPHTPSFTLTLNGQQYVEVDTSARFGYVANAAISLVSPMHGPAEGGTLLRLSGGPFVGSDFRCRFGTPTDRPFHTVANLIHGASGAAELLCVSPARLSGAVLLEVSTNGQQYSTTATTFYVYSPPRVHALSPNSGPAQGTALTLLGSFGGGANFRCRFESLDTFVPATRVPASHAVLLCATPTGAPALKTVVEVSLNAQQFTTDGFSLTLHGVPVVSASSPSSGPAGGSTLVLVRGSGFYPAADLRCKFDRGAVQATYVSSSAITCFAPHGNSTREYYDARASATDDPKLRSLHGAAAQRSSRPHSSFALTSIDHYSAGSLLIDVHAGLAFTAASFEVNLNQTVVTGDSTSVVATHLISKQQWSTSQANDTANGLSFSYGDVARAVVSERGAGLGLRVQLRLQGHSELQIVLCGRKLARRPLALPTNEPVPIRISVHNAELTVEVGGVVLVSHLPLPSWRPLPTWRMAFGARSGASFTQYVVHAIALIATMYSDAKSVPVEVRRKLPRYVRRTLAT